MAKTAVFCIATNEGQAAEIIDELRRSGFSENDISMLRADRSGTMDLGHERHTKAPEGATTGVVSGSLVGGAVGLLAGIGALAIPGLGPFIAAGPLLAALSGAAVGGTAGGVIGALVGMGIPEFEAKRYESKLKKGNILMSVHSDSGEQTSRAKDIFKQAGADDITSTGEKKPASRP